MANDGRRQIEAFEEDFLRNSNYYDFTWRLDVEIARRNARNVCDPKYMIRLDLLSRNQSRNQVQGLNPNQNQGNLSHLNPQNHSEFLGVIENKENQSSFMHSSGIEDENAPVENENEFSQQNTLGFREDVKQYLEYHHLQSDYANLKKMEEEIQQALNSLNVSNSQIRIDYNS